MTFQVTGTRFVSLTARVCLRTLSLTLMCAACVRRTLSSSAHWVMWTASRSTSPPSASPGRRFSGPPSGRAARLRGGMPPFGSLSWGAALAAPLSPPPPPLLAPPPLLHLPRGRCLLPTRAPLNHLLRLPRRLLRLLRCLPHRLVLRLRHLQLLLFLKRLRTSYGRWWLSLGPCNLLPRPRLPPCPPLLLRSLLRTRVRFLLFLRLSTAPRLPPPRRTTGSRTPRPLCCPVGGPPFPRRGKWGRTVTSGS